MTDKHTLDLARQWAADVDADRQALSQDTIDAAADLISSLPDTIVDGDKLREVLDKWEGRKITSDLYTLYCEVEALLPAPPAPRTMAEIEWDDEEHYLMEATAAWSDENPSTVVMLGKSGKRITVYQSDPNYSGLRELNPGILTPTGKKYRLEPEENDFDPAYTYRDKDEDQWEYIEDGWFTGDTHADRVAKQEIFAGLPIPPAEYGPYTQINKEASDE